MDRLLLSHIPVVLAVARTRSFARAAVELGLGASAASHAVRAVERRLGTPLFARTTRSVALTDAGTAFVAEAGRAIAALEGVADRVREAGGQVVGTLRVNAPTIALPMALMPILAEMGRRHPHLVLEVVSDDALTDVVAAGFDAGIRLGEMIARDMVAVRLTPPCRAIMIAAPDYLARRGTPTTIGDLARHNCIGYRLLASGSVYAWELRDGGADIAVEVAGTVRVSTPSHACELARAGLGIAYVFEPLARPYLATGQVLEVMPEAAITEPGLFLYFPRPTERSAKLRALLDVVRDLRER